MNRTRPSVQDNERSSNEEESQTPQRFGSNAERIAQLKNNFWTVKYKSSINLIGV